MGVAGVGARASSADFCRAVLVREVNAGSDLEVGPRRHVWTHSHKALCHKHNDSAGQVLPRRGEPPVPGDV